MMIHTDGRMGNVKRRKVDKGLLAANILSALRRNNSMI